MQHTKVLEVDALKIGIKKGKKEIPIVNGVTFNLYEGETLGIVGESGCGKSMTSLSLMGLLPKGVELFDGNIYLDQLSFKEFKSKDWRNVRGQKLSMIFQEPMSSLNPVYTIRKQVREMIKSHMKVSNEKADARTLEMLKLVGIPRPDEVLDYYPHQLSGGMRQRIMIAMALVNNPKILIADEPTTALDVTIQAQILQLMKDIQEKLGTSIILITHDFGVVAGMCDHVIVMKDGEVVESGMTDDLFKQPKHPYTQKLLNALPKLHEKKVTSEKILIEDSWDSSQPIIEVENLQQHFDLGQGNILKAVNQLTFSIDQGETLGLVGESGSGKSTTGRSILRLLDPTGGSVLYKGVPIHKLNKKELKQMRRHMQIIFQDPYSSLNPRFKIMDIIGSALDLHKLCKTKEERKERIEQLLELVGLERVHAYRYPHEFSGGQRQRIGIARALAVEPQFIVCDEPLSALDVSIQAQVVKLLKDLQQKLGLTYLFIAHDLAMVKHICDRVAVMYAGKIVELAESEELYSNPIHPYTKSLLDAIPIPDPEIERNKTRSTFSYQQKDDPYNLENSEFIEVSEGHWAMMPTAIATKP